MPITDGKAWIRTFTGKKFFPLGPDFGEFDIEDIAHALSNQCRFSGHVRFFYSVAQHCVNVSYEVPEVDAYEALMHDASEAYLQDMPTPIKMMMPEYKKAEKVLETAIEAHFGLIMDDDARINIRAADLKLLATEARDLMGNPQDWESLQGLVPCTYKIVPASPAVAKAAFLDRYMELISG